ncbi:MAG: GatB/YqeY domain-containing protein [Chloroflexota bacterium]
MSLADRLQADMKDAMRDGDALKRDTLRMVLSAAHNAQVAARRPLTDDELVGVLSKEAKTRRESIEAFSAVGRTDLADKERAEAGIIAAYLPAALTEDEIRAMVAEAISTTGASSARDLGKVMGALSPRIRGRADGKQVSGLVAQELAKLDLVAHAHGGGGGS